jgi:hypothetical protein
VSNPPLSKVSSAFCLTAEAPEVGVVFLVLLALLAAQALEAKEVAGVFLVTLVNDGVVHLRC